MCRLVARTRHRTGGREKEKGRGEKGKEGTLTVASHCQALSCYGGNGNELLGEGGVKPGVLRNTADT